MPSKQDVEIMNLQLELDKALEERLHYKCLMYVSSVAGLCIFVLLLLMLGSLPACR